jgi:hypothetical protein
MIAHPTQFQEPLALGLIPDTPQETLLSPSQPNLEGIARPALSVSAGQRTICASKSRSDQRS